MTDPYQILGVPKTATQDEIKKAYRALAKKNHPDLNPGNKEAETRFKAVSDAYGKLDSPETRAKFDRGDTDEQRQDRAREQYANQQSQQSSYYNTQQNQGRYSEAFGQGFEDGDFFENILRNAGPRAGMGAGRKRAAPTDYPGEDQLYRLEVEFKDAALGAEREITLPTGKKLLIKIPAGIEEGKRLRFKGQGGAGMGKGPAGDALVEISVKSLEGFTRSGINLESELPLSFQEGLLGAEIKVATLDGNVMLKVPAGTSTGARLRVRGKGVGAANQRGDQIFIAKVVLPKKVDPAFQEAVRKLGAQFDYNPRAAEDAT